MPTEIKLPVLGENVDSGTVVKVLVSVGDAVTEDTPVVDLLAWISIRRKLPSKSPLRHREP